ncbi:MAG: hypothetical protein OEX81_00525 [Candidatus Pacebacteria bacterium]|nr:hypothetical protein [Candidatus Paceibacterota bacterium]
MKKFLIIALLLSLIVPTISFAQDSSDYSRLMDGEEVILDWGVTPVFDMNALNFEYIYPPAYELIREFVFQNVDDDMMRFYALFEITVNSSPETLFQNGTVINGAHATSMQWAEDTNTLYITITNEVQNECSVSYGDILVTQYSECNGDNFSFPTATYYSNIFTVIYIRS